jgi:hypothetical protein
VLFNPPGSSQNTYKLPRRHHLGADSIHIFAPPELRNRDDAGGGEERRGGGEAAMPLFFSLFFGLAIFSQKDILKIK